MTYKIRIVPEAKIEIKKAREWYENQSLGLGQTFSDEVKKAIRALSSSQIDYKPVFTTHRRILLSKFPYTIYYKRNEENLIVWIIAILHNKQSQSILENRL